MTPFKKYRSAVSGYRCAERPAGADATVARRPALGGSTPSSFEGSPGLVVVGSWLPMIDGATPAVVLAAFECNS
ncbi:hypothetical protein, partial [Mycolicibacterium setense]|uniref:hypothetical protein n=1 Tax=Mycolicibacterium setense TaxID=431269 RepID=UPI0021F28134